MGKPLSRDYRSIIFLLAKAPRGSLWHPFTESGWDTPQSPAPSCVWVHRLTSVRETLSSVNPSSTPQTPVEHLEVKLGKVTRPERCKRNLGFPLSTAAAFGQHCNTRENRRRVELLLLRQKFTGSNTTLMSAAPWG